MEDKKDTNSCNSSCGVHCGDNKWSGSCAMGCCGHGKHRCIRKILILIFIFIVFCFGMQLGELKGELKATYRLYGVSNKYDKSANRSNMMWTYQYQNPAAPQINIPSTY